VTLFTHETYCQAITTNKKQYVFFPAGQDGRRLSPIGVFGNYKNVANGTYFLEHPCCHTWTTENQQITVVDQPIYDCSSHFFIIEDTVPLTNSRFVVMITLRFS